LVDGTPGAELGSALVLGAGPKVGLRNEGTDSLGVGEALADLVGEAVVVALVLLPPASDFDGPVHDDQKMMMTTNKMPSTTARLRQ
jgi:hypothetical protein